MSQFDQTTEEKAGELFFALPGSSEICVDQARAVAKDFRNSTKASMEILARALVDLEQCRGRRSGISDMHGWKHAMAALATEAIAQVKANGDWPLEEKIF